MKQQRTHISRKPLHGKNINSRLQRWRKANISFSPEQGPPRRKEDPLRINEQSISFIANKHESSFISGQEPSIDSFEQIIIGQVLDLDDTENMELNYSRLYKDFQTLCKGLPDKDFSSEQSLSKEEHSRAEDLDSSINRDNSMSRGENRLREKMEEVREGLKQRTSSDPNISLRLLGANLSEIHQEEMQQDSSMHRMDPIEEEFIDFVSKGQGPNRINISKIEEEHVREKKVSFKGDAKENEEDEVVAMLENELVSREGQEESITEEPSLSKKPKHKDNYNHILTELEDHEDKQLANAFALLAKRAEWIHTRQDRSEEWKLREIQQLNKFRQILANPFVDHPSEEDLSIDL